MGVIRQEDIPVDRSIIVPITLESIINSLLLAGVQGATELSGGRLVVSLPSGTATEYTADYSQYPGWEGWSIVFTKPITTSASFHHQNISCHYEIFGENTYRSQWFYLTKDFEFDIRLLQGLIINRMKFTYQNLSPNDTIVTVDSEGFFIERSLYERVISIILRNNFKYIEEYAEYIKQKLILS